jgi:hypothetical protein
VPPGISSLSLTAVGGGGGDGGGSGGDVSGNLKVTAGEVLTIVAAGQGGDGTASTGGAGGYGGGGAGNIGGGGGGGATVFSGPGAKVQLVAGGGGGNGADSADGIWGGVGGALVEQRPVTSTAPPTVKTGKATRDTTSGVITVTLDATINPVELCGIPDLVVSSPATAHRGATFVFTPLTQISGGTATAKLPLSAGDSCWVTGFVRIAQAVTTAYRYSPPVDVSVARAQIKTAKAVRSAKGVTVDLKVIGLPPANPCRHATLRVNNRNITTLKAVHMTFSGGTVTAQAVRAPQPSNCVVRMHFEVIPPSGIGAPVSESVKISGGPPSGSAC